MSTATLHPLHDADGSPFAAPQLAPAAARVIDAVKVYGRGENEVRALDGVSVEFATGRFTAIMGPSGSGKSTLMHLLAGLDKPTTGDVFIDGTRLTALNDTELTKLRRKHIGFVFQFFNLLPMLTAEENVTLPARIAGEKVDATWLETVLEQVGLADRRSHRPSELSGGQQQRVAIARAIFTRPTVLFGDEPTGNLDSTTSSEILEVLRSAVETYRQTTIMVTHDPRAAATADRVLFLADGRTVSDFAPDGADAVLSAMKELTRR